MLLGDVNFFLRDMEPCVTVDGIRARLYVFIPRVWYLSNNRQDERYVSRLRPLRTFLSTWRTHVNFVRQRGIRKR